MPTTAAEACRPAGRHSCAAYPDLFQHPLLEDPPRASADRAERKRYNELVREATQVCSTCPMLRACLYKAVVEHDVAGFVAGTTERQRGEIRRRLGIRVQPEDLDTLAGVMGGHRQIDHDEVIRMRQANPHESLETVARRLGCSLSTVKRHLRRERTEPTVRQAPPPKPTLPQVMSTAAAVVSAGRPEGFRAA